MDGFDVLKREGWNGRRGNQKECVAARGDVLTIDVLTGYLYKNLPHSQTNDNMHE
jgi:hypothetical protein